QDFAVLDQQETGDALTRKEIVECERLIFETVFDLRRAGRFGNRQRRRRFRQRIVGQYLVEIAERSDPHALVEEPVGARADWIPRRLTQQLLVRRRRGRTPEREQRTRQ